MLREIYVIGSMSIDLVTRVSRRPQKGETILGESFFMTEGGKGANQAVSASRLGASVHMVGCVGSDTFGERILTNLKANNIFVENVETIPHFASGIAQIMLSEEDNSIVVVPGANFKVSINQVEKVIQHMRNDSIVVLQNEIPKEVVEYIIERCYQRQITTIYNPAPSVAIDSEYFQKVSYFTPNETEVIDLFGATYEDVIVSYKNKMIVTLGSDGVIYYDESLKKIPGLKVDVVDTTGAGDTFNGAFAVALSEGKSLNEALCFSNKAASISVQALGAQGGMPWRKEVDDYYV